MSFQSPSDYSQEEMLCSNVLSPESFSDDADEGTIEEAENTSRVDAVGSDPKDATLSQKKKAINRVCPQVCTVCSGPANGRRTSCRACRYNKCVEVGMKPQLVQLSNDVISSRSSHVQTSKDTQFHETPLAMHSITAKLLWFDESEFAAIIGTLIYNESQCDFLRRSTFDPTGTRLSLADLISAPSELYNLHAYQLIREWPVKQPPPMDYHGQLRCTGPHTSKFWILCDLVVSVEFMKTLTFFERLSHSDKLLLSKNVALANCSLMQSYYSYKSKSNAIVFPDGIFPILFTKRPPPVEVILSYGGIEPLIRSMIDECEYVLLKAIIFTHYSCEGLSVQGRTLLELERQKFVRALFNYTGARYGATIGSCRFAELLALVGTFFHLADKHRQFHTLLSIIVHPQKHHSILLEEMLA